MSPNCLFVPTGPVARCVLTLFPEQKLFRVSESSAEGLTQLCTHLLGCDPKTEPGGAEVGGACEWRFSGFMGVILWDPL